MSANGRTQDGSVWRWTEKLFTAEDLRRHHDGQTELVLPARTIVSPLAADELRAKGIRVRREEAGAATVASRSASGRWLVTQESPEPLVHAALEALSRDKGDFDRIEKRGSVSGWVRDVAADLRKHERHGAVMFCGDAALIVCLANRLTGLRAAAVAGSRQAARVLKTLGANVLAIELPGPSYFEIRSILRTVAATRADCPAETRRWIEEVESHANR